MLGSADDINFYTKNGYWKNNVGITIEAAFQDWAIAQMAQKPRQEKRPAILPEEIGRMEEMF